MIEPKIARSLTNAAPNPLFLRDEELTWGIELLDAAYRAVVEEPDRELVRRGLGRNHRWILYLVGRHPGITMVELLTRMRVAKQTLSRLLNDLVAKGLIARQPNVRDRRQRLLELTKDGRDLEEALHGRLRRRLAGAYRAAGAEAVAGHHQVLLGLVERRGGECG
ncbi:MAG TPA: MarR family transcriptional regulator [Geminicoccaceae bacterium]|nr:MarR family transcriptional regulator [Geminicoccaceae bacterium]